MAARRAGLRLKPPLANTTPPRASTWRWRLPCLSVTERAPLEEALPKLSSEVFKAKVT
jgi:hypothetical protein